MKLIKIFVLAFPILTFAQQKKSLVFNQMWQLSSSKYNQYYKCETFELENGNLDGPFTCYKIGTDSLVKKYQFKNNQLDGEITEYHNNGMLKLKAFYKEGQPIQEWKEWDINGELIVEKIFDENGIITRDKQNKQISEYEKIYFGSKKFEAPIYTTKCIQTRIEQEKYKCSNKAIEEYSKVPPLPPFYFEDVKFRAKIFYVKLKFQISHKGKVNDVRILETSGDDFLDSLAITHISNMLPFESAKSYGNPINHWLETILVFDFNL